MRVAIIGGGPAGLTLAAALAQQGGFEIAVFERADDHFTAETSNPDRSDTIDITGHGLRAARFIGITDRFDAALIHFKGLRIALHPWLRRLGAGFAEEPYHGRGWTGSRGDICRCSPIACTSIAIRWMLGWRPTRPRGAGKPMRCGRLR